MTRNLKVLGLALAAVFAMSAVGASAASANTVFTSPENTGTTFLTGAQEGNHEFEVAGQVITCEVATFAGSQTGTEAEEVTITPTYEECEYNELPVQVTMNGCDYLFTGETVGDHSVVHVDCRGGGPIIIHMTIAGGPCTLTVGQAGKLVTPGRGVTYTNEPGNGGTTRAVINHATADVKIEGAHNGGFFCSILSGSTSEYRGTTTLKGYSDSGHTNQVGIEVS